MKKYENLDNFRERVHVVEITFQSGEFKGTIKQKIGGNCFGLDILMGCNTDCLDLENLYENDCNLELLEDEDDEDNLGFRCILKDENGDVCEIEDEIEELNRLIVKLEIVDCQIVDK